MAQLENIEAIEKRLWKAADTLRSNSELASNEYFLPRLPFGLPGTNKNKKVPNANYLWIQYFYSYLNKSGRAGFVMSSQASSAGREEAKVREQLVKTCHVEAMIDIRGNFFYTRTVPCQLWFFNKAKTAVHRDTVLMIDARNVYRKVTRKVMDFSPEQSQNLSAIVWLYRGQEQRFVDLVASYLNAVLTHLRHVNRPSQQQRGVRWFLVKLQRQLRTLDELNGNAGATEELRGLWQQLHTDAQHFKATANGFAPINAASDLAMVKRRETALAPLAETSRDLVKSIDHLDKLTANHTQQALEQLKEHVKHYTQLHSLMQRNRKTIEHWRKHAVEQLKQVRYFYKQAHWLLVSLPGRQTGRRAWSGQTGGCARHRRRGLEPNPRPLCQRGPGRSG